MAARFSLPMLSLFGPTSEDVLRGGLLYFDASGTSTPLNTFSDNGLTTPNTNPVVLDSAGRHADIFLAVGPYKVTIKTSTGITIKTMDPVDGNSVFSYLNSLTGAVPRQATSKLDDTVSVKDFGAVIDGVTDDAAAINLALATGKSILIPAGTCLTAGAHAINTAGQQIYGVGRQSSIKKKAGAVQPIFKVNDVANVGFHNLCLDGTRASFSAGNVVSGVHAWRAKGLHAFNVEGKEFIDAAFKLLNCPDTHIDDTCYFHDITNIAVEIKSYATDPRTAAAWAGSPTVSNPSGYVSGLFENIDDGLSGAGNGGGVDFAPGAGALPIRNLTISGRYRDVLRPIHSESNYAGTESRDITIIGVQIRGNVAGSGTIKCYQGIGLVGVQHCNIIAPVIRNVGNFAPGGGSTAGIIISETVGVTVSSDINIINAEITDDTGAADRTDYGILLSAGRRIKIRGGRIDGMSDAAISAHATNVTFLSVKGVDGAENDYAWSDGIIALTFKIDNIPATATTALNFTAGYTAATLAYLPVAGVIVGSSVHISAAHAAGDIQFKFYSNNAERTPFQIGAGDFAGSVVKASKRITLGAGTVVAKDTIYRVDVVTDGSFLPTTLDATATILIDTTYQQ